MIPESQHNDFTPSQPDSYVRRRPIRQPALRWDNRNPGPNRRTDVGGDARVLAAFGAALRPKPTPLLSRQQKRLRELESQRRHLSQVLRAEENRLAQLQCAELR
jgi:hypothetical protein